MSRAVVVGGFWMGGAMTYNVVRASMQEREAPAQRVDIFWVVLSASGPPIPLKVTLPDGREALALFSGEDEARMYCSLREEAEPNPHFRETSVGEVISLLYCPLTAARHVALDPLPGILGSKLSGLITLDRERFARSFAGIGTQGFLGKLFEVRQISPQATQKLALAHRATSLVL